MMHGFGFGMGLGGILLMVLFWALIIAAIVWLARAVANPAKSSSGSPALEILERRFAQGELDREEFLKMKKDLS